MALDGKTPSLEVHVKNAVQIARVMNLCAQDLDSYSVKSVHGK